MWWPRTSSVATESMALIRSCIMPIVYKSKKMKPGYMTLSAALALSFAVGAAAQPSQEPVLWSLDRCIGYALEHNLTVKSRDLDRQQRYIDLNTARNSRLPDVAGSASQNFSFGRGIGADNTYVNTNTASSSVSLGASLNIFNGFCTQRTIKMDALNLEAAVADLEKAKDDVCVSVAQAYVQILYDIEVESVARRQVGIDSVQVVRLRSMRANGKASDAEVAQQEASLGQSRMTLTQARNATRLALLDLTQLLELPSSDGFGIVVPDVDASGLAVPVSAEDIYAQAVEMKPAVKAERLRLDAALAGVGVARSALSPSLSLNGGLGTNYYKSSGYDSARFMDQIKNNFNQYVGVSLNVPVFSRLSARNSIRSARLSSESQRIQLESVKKSLYKEIQQAWHNALAAQDKLRSCEDAQKSAEEAFRLVSAKYENGKATITEFNESRTGLMKAMSDMAQARYESLFQIKLLDFYRGVPLRF